MRDRGGGNAYSCRQVLTSRGARERSDVGGWVRFGGIGGVYHRGVGDRGVIRGRLAEWVHVSGSDYPDGVTNTLHPLHDSIKEFLGWVFRHTVSDPEPGGGEGE